MDHENLEINKLACGILMNIHSIDVVSKYGALEK
jgi:hypothetical protein